MLGPSLSLLWPNGPPSAERVISLSESAAEDLNLAEVIAAIVGGDAPRVRLQQREHFAREILTKAALDPDVITYRQGALHDLLDDPTLRARIEEIVPKLEELAEGTSLSERYRPSSGEGLDVIVRRLAELELFVDVASQLHDTLQHASGRSAAVVHLRDQLDELIKSETFTSLQRELPALRDTLASVRSVKIGINLGPDLAPQSATVLGLSDQRIDGRQALLGRLFGDVAEQQGITPLRRVERGPRGMQNDLGRDLTQLLQDVAAPIASALRRYLSVSVQSLARLGAELGFLLGGVRLIHRLLSAGLPVCPPTILPAQERITELEEVYDPGLALRSSGELVTNPFSFDARQARVWVLSGPNRSGKTTFTRAIGLAHILAQAGLHVPARSARVSPVDAIFTHFPSREAARPGMGRLDEEAERLGAIFHHATPGSLILLNEALAGTSTFEAVDLASGVVRGLRMLGARALYVTHLHELASAVDQLNASTPGSSRIGSLVSEPEAERLDVVNGAPRTFRIRPGAPHGQSFAAQIAQQHGISFSQLEQLLRDRGVVS